MGVYSPSTTSFPNGVVTIESEDDTLYSTIQEAVAGSHNYQINEIYLKSNDISQILQPITFQRYDSNGDILEDKRVPAVDPFSFQPSIKINFRNKDYILDGRLEIDYTVKGGEEVYFYLDTTVLDNGALLGDDKSMPKDFLKTYNFFQDYGKEIEIDFSYDERAIPECTDQEASDFRTENR
jgi:hypothetical protein